MRIRAFLTSLLLAVAVGAQAQFPAGFTPPPQRYNPGLLMNPDVQKDLHLSPDASQKAMNIMMQVGMKMMPSMMGMFSGKKMSKAEESKFMKDILAANNDMQEQTIKLLNPPQRQRLHEITLQQQGANAFTDPILCKEVGLSSQQMGTLHQTLAKISAKSMKSMGDMNFMNGGQKPDMAKIQAMQTRALAAQKQQKAESEAAINSILTSAQKTKFKKMQGRPFQLKGMAGMGGAFGGM